MVMGGEHAEEGGGEGEVGEVQGAVEEGQGRVDMEFKGALGEGGQGVKGAKLMDWNGIGEGAEAEIDRGQADI
jgi:hypothetical protein